MTKEEWRKKYVSNNSFRLRCKWYGLGQRRCHCCGVQLNWCGIYPNTASIEHLVPKSQGGTYAFQNIIVVCITCNNVRKNKDYIKWVIHNNFPKKEWLIAKYFAAVQYYKDTGQNINISTKHLANYK